jgi:hypothetical protein
MSLSISIATRRERLPSAQAWAKRLSDEGFEKRLEWDFDTRSSQGYVPSPDENAGFEYSIGDLDAELERLELPRGHLKYLAELDSLVDLTFAREADLLVSQSAAAALAEMTDGVVIDREAGVVIPPSETRSWARGELVSPQHLEVRPKSPHPVSILSWLRLAVALLLVASVLYKWLGH